MSTLHACISAIVWLGALLAAVSGQSGTFNCPANQGYVNTAFSCNFSLDSTYYETTYLLNVSYGDSSSTQLTMKRQYAISGGAVPTNLTTAYSWTPASTPSTILLANAEVLLQGGLCALEIYATSDGLVSLNIIAPTTSMNGFQSWSEYLLSKTSLSVTTIAQHVVYLRAGYNLVFLKTPVNVYANYLVTWSNGVGTGKIALDASAGIAYPDYYYSSSTSKVSSLNSTSAWRFYVRNVIKSLYQTINKTYSSVGYYTITVALSDNSIVPVSQTINVYSPSTRSFACVSQQVNVSQAVSCYYNVTAVDVDDTILVNFGEYQSTMYSVTANSSINGNTVPAVVTTYSQLNTSSLFLFASTYITVQSGLYGFELYASAPGIAKFTIMNVTTSVSLALGTYLLSNTGLTGNTSLSVYPYLNTGYNFVVFNLSIDLSPGNVIMWDPTYGTAKIALDTTGCTYPDYSYDLSVVSKLDTTYKWQFYFNAATYLYQQSMKIVDLVVNYSGLYKMQVFWNSVLDYSQYINVALPSSTSLNCTTLETNITFPINCTYTFMSSTMDNVSVAVDYGDSNKLSLLLQKSFFNFGLNISYNCSTAAKFVSSVNPYTALLLNSEILQQSTLYGIEVYAYAAGVVRISVLSANSSMGAYTSWGAYMAANANGSISTVSILTIYPNLAAGYNMIFFTTPLDVQANYLISWSSEPGSGLLALDKDSAVIYPDYLYDGSSVSALSKTTPYRFYAHAITKYNYQIQQMEKAFAYPTSYNMSFVVSGTPGLTQAATVKADLIGPFIYLTTPSDWTTGILTNVSIVVNSFNLLVDVYVDYGNGLNVSVTNINTTTPILLNQTYLWYEAGKYNLSVQTVPWPANVSQLINVAPFVPKITLVCQDAFVDIPINCSVQVDNRGVILDLNIDFGDYTSMALVVNDSNPILFNHTYPQVITYTITASTSPYTNSKSVSFQVNNYIPTVGLTCNTTVAPQTGVPVTCKMNVVSVLPLQVFVDYGDGTTDMFNGSAVVVFMKIYTAKGTYTVTAQTTPYLSAVSTQTFKVIGVTVCIAPVVTMESQTPIGSPTQVQRSKMFSVAADTSFSCPLNIVLSQQWLVTSVRSNGSIIGAVNISSIDSSAMSEIVIPALFLPYGYYNFAFQFNFSYTNELMLTKTFYSTVNTYVQIVPTGIAVSGFPNGMSQSLFGTKQQVAIDPGTNSVDLDYIADPSKLNYTFYCRVINASDTSAFSVYPTDVNSTTLVNVTRVKNLYLITYDNLTCFKSSNSNTSNYTLSTSALTISRLQYINNIVYQFYILTNYLGVNYSQVLTAQVSYLGNIPSVLLGCKFSLMCKMFPTYQMINSNTQTIITSSCPTGCEYGDITYKYSIYQWVTNQNGTSYWSQLTKFSEYLISGTETFEVTLLPALFTTYKNVTKYKVQLQISIDKNITGLSSMVVALNQLPTGGFCTLDLLAGVALHTYFTITCKNWYDPDGKITRYEYYSIASGDLQPSNLNYNSNGILNTQLPMGTGGLSIYVAIIDDFNGKTVFYLPDKVAVRIDEAVTNSQMNTIISGGSFFNSMKGTNLQSSAKQIIGLAATMNSMASTGSTTKASSSASAGQAQRSSVRDAIITQVSALPMSSSANLKLFSTVMAVMTRNSSENTAGASKTSINIVSNMVSSLKNQGNSTSLDDILQISNGIFETVSNSYASISGPLLNKDGFVSSDSSTTDLKKAMSEATAKAEPQLLSVSKLIGSHLSANQAQKISTSSVEITFMKQSVTDMSSVISADGGSFQISNYTQLLEAMRSSGANTSNGTSSLTRKFSSYNSAVAGSNSDNIVSIDSSASPELEFYDPITNEPISVKNLATPLTLAISRQSSYSVKSPMSLNVTRSNFSSSQIFLKYKVNATYNSSLHIQLHLAKRTTNVTVGYLTLLKFNPSATSVNKNATDIDYDLYSYFCPSDARFEYNETFFMFFVNMSTVNSYGAGVVSLAIRELNSTEMWVRCAGGSGGVYTAANTSTSLSLNGTSNSTVHRNATYSFNTTISFSANCGDSVNNPRLDFSAYANTSLNFTHELYLRVFTSACYWFDDNGNWQTSGTDVLATTTIYTTYCTTTHLTKFGGGMQLLPPSIDFNDAFANANPLQNLTIFITLLVCMCAYIIFAIYFRYLDVKDAKKIGVTNLANNGDEHVYEVTVFTGARLNSATRSNVSMILAGNMSESQMFHLHDKKRRVFDRGSCDTFIISSPNDLGTLKFIRIWHDNSGRGNSASWYLKNVIVKEARTGVKAYFICEKWFSVVQGDGLIDRILPVSGKRQKTEFKYLLAKNTTQNLRDGHLWFSLIARPIDSTFNRVDRFTCCYVIIFTNMFMSILWYRYTSAGNTGDDGIKIGPLSITLEQIYLSIFNNLCTIPPNMLIMNLFRRAKPKPPKKSKKRLQQEKEKEKEKPKKKKKDSELKFPWWAKIIAYVLSFILIMGAAFMIYISAALLGNAGATKWLTSAVMSTFCSIIFIQPLQVAVIAFVLVAICRKVNDEKVNTDDSDKEKKTGKSGGGGASSGEFTTMTREKAQPLDEVQIAIMRKERQKELEMEKVFKQIFLYVLFLALLFVVTYSNSDNNTTMYTNANMYYTYKSMLINILTSGQFYSSSQKVYQQINTPSDFWSWMQTNMSQALKSTKVNGTYKLIDRYSILLDNPMLRQLRVKNNSCTVNSHLSSQIGYCSDELSSSSEDKDVHHWGWSEYNATYNASYSVAPAYNAFSYTKSSQMSSYPFVGAYATYSGGGYIYLLNGTLKQVLGNLSLLQTNGWIDRQTRAVFVEFSVYNVNINLFAYCVFLFEFLPTGNVVSTVQVTPLDILGTQNGISLTTICYVVLVVVMIVLAVKEVRMLKRHGVRVYFKNFWSYVEWLMFAFTFAAMCMYLYRLYAAYELMGSFNAISNATVAKTRKYKYINLQLLANWNDLLNIMFGILAAFGTLKFFKILQFNKNITMIANVLTRAFEEIFYFVLSFMIVFMAFVQALNILFHKEFSGFSSIAASMQTSFSYVISLFDESFFAIIYSGSITAAVLFCSFSILIIFVLMGMFVTILTGAFEREKDAARLHKNEMGMFDYLKKKIQSVLGIGDETTLKMGPVYLEYLDTFEIRIDQLLNTIDTVIKPEKSTIEEHD